MQMRHWWDLVVIGTGAMVASIIAAFPPYDAGSWGAWGAIAGVLIVYLALGRRLLDAGRMPQSMILAALLAALVGIGSFFEPQFSIMQTVVYPMIWFTAASTRGAVIGNVLVAACLWAGWIARGGADNLLAGLGIAVLSLAFSLALGLWITRIAEFGEERARLLAELESAQEQLAAMHREAGVTSERARIAREIHDTIAQSLTGVVMLAQQARTEIDAGAGAERVELIESMSRDALTEARGLVASLAPVAVGTGLGDALARLGARFERETGVAVTVEVDVGAVERELEVVLLRCAQEGLANVRKHARARAVRVEVARQGAELVLTVADDGVGLGLGAPGFETAVDGLLNPPEGSMPMVEEAVHGRLETAHDGFGIAGMRERLALVGGRLELSPGAGSGAVLVVRVPTEGAG